MRRFLCNLFGHKHPQRRRALGRYVGVSCLRCGGPYPSL